MPGRKQSVTHYNYMKTLLLIAIFAATAFSQLTVTELQTKAKASKANKDVVIMYDKFKDLTSVATKPYNLIGGGESFAAGMLVAMSQSPYSSHRDSPPVMTSLNVSLFHTFKGDKLTASPDTFNLMFDSGSSGWIFLKGDRNLYILYDESRLELHPIATDNDVLSRSVSETLAFEITRDQLNALIKAKQVAIKLGPMPRKVKQGFTQRLNQMVGVLTM